MREVSWLLCGIWNPCTFLWPLRGQRPVWRAQHTWGPPLCHRWHPPRPVVTIFRGGQRSEREGTFPWVLPPSFLPLGVGTLPAHGSKKDHKLGLGDTRSPPPWTGQRHRDTVPVACVRMVTNVGSGPRFPPVSICGLLWTLTSPSDEAPRPMHPSW